MRELIDCHIHTELCGHASGSAAQMVGAAVFAGLSGIVMTEHLPLPDGLDPNHHLAMRDEDFAGYVDDVRALAARAKGLRVVLGVEADWLPGHEEHTARLRARAQELGVDIVMGSVHFLGDWVFDDPNDLSGWDARDVRAAYDEYFATWCDAARSGLYDVMAHPDLIKKFGHRPEGDLTDYYVAAADAAKAGGVLIEASTAGWRKPVSELYPAPGLLAAFADRGVGATVGSDAHSPTEVGHRITDAYDALATAGYREVVFPLGEKEIWRIDL